MESKLIPSLSKTPARKLLLFRENWKRPKLKTMPQIRNKWLRNLLEEAEFDREHEEVKMIEQTIRSLVEEISKSIAEKDPLFKNTVLRSGSFYEDLKVDGPNEFDFIIIIIIINYCLYSAIYNYKINSALHNKIYKINK